MRALQCVLPAIILGGVSGCAGGGEVRPVPPAFQDGFSGTWIRNASLRENPQEATGRGGGGRDAFGGGAVEVPEVEEATADLGGRGGGRP